MPEKKRQMSQATSDNLTMLFIILIVCLTYIVALIVNGEYTIKLQSLRGSQRLWY